MPHKDPEKLKQYKKEYYHKNKEKNKQYYKEYNQTPLNRKKIRINRWKRWGIIFHDYDLLHDIYLSTTHCYFCKCLLNQCGSSRKCVDHNHDIHDNDNVREILCNSCNVQGVLD